VNITAATEEKRRLIRICLVPSWFLGLGG